MAHSFDLYFAIQDGDDDLARQIIAHDLSLVRSGHLGQTWLHYAAQCGRTELLRELIVLGLDVNSRGDDGIRTPLDYAAGKGHIEAASFLIKAGAQVDQCTLIAAVDSGTLGMVRLLVDNYIQSQENSLSQLDVACDFALASGHRNIVDYFLSLGFTPQERVDSSPERPHREIIEHFATYYGPVDSVSQNEVAGGLVAISIHKVPPEVNNDPWILFTTGMSDRPLSVPTGYRGDRYAELVIRLPGDWPMTRDALNDYVNSWPFEWLRRAAHYFHNRDTWIGSAYGLVVNGDPPEPLAPGLTFDSMLLVSVGQDHERIVLRDGREVGVYSLIALYPAEREFGTRAGLQMLNQRIHTLERPGVVDLSRPCVNF